MPESTTLTLAAYKLALKLNGDVISFPPNVIGLSAEAGQQATNKILSKQIKTTDQLTATGQFSDRVSPLTQFFSRYPLLTETPICYVYNLNNVVAKLPKKAIGAYRLYQEVAVQACDRFGVFASSVLIDCGGVPILVAQKLTEPPISIERPAWAEQLPPNLQACLDSSNAFRIFDTGQPQSDRTVWNVLKSFESGA